jgi:hypothetical protein
MIDRLVSSLRQLATLPAEDIGSASNARLRGDCADALRLELDCPQQELTPVQRADLLRLSDALESGSAPDRLADAVRTVSRALGILERDQR